MPKLRNISSKNLSGSIVVLVSEVLKEKKCRNTENRTVG